MVLFCLFLCGVDTWNSSLIKQMSYSKLTLLPRSARTITLSLRKGGGGGGSPKYFSIISRSFNSQTPPPHPPNINTYNGFAVKPMTEFAIKSTGQIQRFPPVTPGTLSSAQLKVPEHNGMQKYETVESNI